MRYLQLGVSGRWAHFRKPETNNNPLTHDFITKTALIGLIGAVVGSERRMWREQFPLLSEALLYGVQVKRAVKKESWGFTLRSVSNPNELSNRAPRAMELLREPKFIVVVALRGETSADIFERFARCLQNSEACYQPVLGLHPCAAELEYIGRGEAQAASGVYSTSGFVLRSQKPQMPLDQPGVRLGFERIPSSQTADWWNRPEDYREVVYPFGGSVSATGEHFVCDDGAAWCLI